jgi:hypothetical protein
MSWKQKTRINIMKRIRDNTLLGSIPESETIQMVINALYPVIFETRNETKYFLTILGDNILRKNTSNIHFINQSAKQFIKNMNNICQMLIGSNISQSFKYKYHDHSYHNCRIIDINECIKNDDIWSSIINKYALDILCVSTYYSTRYNNADEFILNVCNDNVLSDRVLFIKNIEQFELVNDFISKFIDIDTTIIVDNTTHSTHITWKNMQYLWKLFLDSNRIPSIIFSNTLKLILINKFEKYYNLEIDTFIGICSKYIPSIQIFLQFWNCTMVVDDAEGELEIDEVVTLLRRWCETNNENTPGLSDKQLLDIMYFYIPSIAIEDDKYISNMRCTLWDKSSDITTALDHMREQLYTDANSVGVYTNINTPTRPISPSIYKSISIYDTYQYYCKFTKVNNRKLVVSKSYFENYIYDNLNEYLIDENFISAEWYIQ